MFAFLREKDKQSTEDMFLMDQLDLSWRGQVLRFSYISI